MSSLSFFAALTLFITSSLAHPEYLNNLPNGGGENFYQDPILGHISDTDPGARNDFGSAFSKAKLTWTQSVCEADTDGDGQSNGFEMGDECCQWHVGCKNESFLATDSLSFPGDKSSLSDRIVCSCTGPPLCDCCSSPSPCDPLPSASSTSSPTPTATATIGTSSSSSPTPTPSAPAQSSSSSSDASTIEAMVGVGVGGGLALFAAAWVYYYITTQCGGGKGGGSRSGDGMAASDGLSSAEYSSLN